MNIGNDGLALIKEFEGRELEAYVDPVGILTIGYGSTGPHVKPGMKITGKEAEELLKKDLVRFENAVNNLVKVPLTQSMFDALVSFAFNCGIGAFQNSMLLRLLNQRDYVGASAQFDRWVQGNDGPLPGLVRRRDAEEALFRRDGFDIGPAAGAKAQITHPVTKIKATQATLLKKGPVQGSDLKANEKVDVPQGKTYEVVWQGKEADGHVKVSLAHGGGNWYVFAPHWAGLSAGAPPSNTPPPVKPGDVKLLSTPYYSQRDNIPSGKDLPYRTCFSSSCAMLASTVKPGCITGDDDYIKKRQRFGDSTDASAQVKCLNSLGIKARFITNGNNGLVKKQIDRGIPVPCGILHHGPASSPTGDGHWICVIGYDATGFIVNDPWGEIDHRTGTYPKTNGKHVHYSYSLFDSRWTVANSSDGWCIVVD